MNNGKSKVAAKGDRLNWTPLKNVKPVKLSSVLGKGQVLTDEELKGERNQISKIVLVP